LSVSVRPKPTPAIHATTSSGTATASTSTAAVRAREPRSVAAVRRNSAVTAGRKTSPAPPSQERRMPQVRVHAADFDSFRLHDGLAGPLDASVS
jgi:hypothetical protein